MRKTQKGLGTTEKITQERDGRPDRRAVRIGERGESTQHSSEQDIPPNNGNRHTAKFLRFLMGTFWLFLFSALFISYRASSL